MVKKYLILLLSLTSCGVFKSRVPQPKIEFRGFWVATVVNIDWPKNGKDAIEKQKADYIEILDFYQKLNFNAAIVQIRTAGDAFYSSDYAPWSRFLTGSEGEFIKSKENVLSWMIKETHKRGMEFHAWLNPYRATFDLKTEILSPSHDFNLHPEWMLKYGKKYYYDPGLPEVQERMVSVIDEIVSKYDVDAIHFDDYFYPYTIRNEIFNDETTYYNCAKPEQSLGDWRRSNIDSLIKKSYDIIKTRKPWVQFGVSPFGVWKNNSTDPKGSDTKAGQTTYENLYADPLLWMEKGWIDYLIPQVYWSMGLPVASHRKIVDWWANNSTNTNLYIGNGAYKVRNNSDTAWNDKKELPQQIRLARETDAVLGNVFFSAKSLMHGNDDVVDYLKKKYYKRSALPPISPFVSDSMASPITFEKMNVKVDSVFLTFNGLKKYRYALIYSSRRKLKTTYPIKKLLVKSVVEKGIGITVHKNLLKHKKNIALTFIDKFGKESNPIIIHLSKLPKNKTN